MINIFKTIKILKNRDLIRTSKSFKLRVTLEMIRTFGHIIIIMITINEVNKDVMRRKIDYTLIFTKWEYMFKTEVYVLRSASRIIWIIQKDRYHNVLA